jgi:hypothetical protein
MPRRRIHRLFARSDPGARVDQWRIHVSVNTRHTDTAGVVRDGGCQRRVTRVVSTHGTQPAEGRGVAPSAMMDGQVGAIRETLTVGLGYRHHGLR